MFEKLKTYYVVLCIVLFALGFIFDLFSSNIGLEPKALKMFDSKGEIIDREVLTSPLKKQVLNIFSTFLYTLAASIFISVFVTNRIEANQRKKQETQLEALQEAVNENVFDSLFKTLIPEEIFRTIKEEIIENKIIRKNDIWLYDFSVISPKEIELRQTLKNQLHNVGRDFVQHPLELELYSMDGMSAGIESISFELDGKAIMAYDVSCPDKTIGAEKKTNGNLTTLLCTVKIPPQRHVEMTMVLKHRYNDLVRDAYFINYPIINASLVVNFPDDYEFDLFSSFSNELRCTMKNSNRHIYEMNGAALPNQGFFFVLTKMKSV